MKDIQVTADFELNDELKAKYIEAIQKLIEQNGEDANALSRIVLKSIDDNNVSADYFTEDEDAPKFERIARIN